MDGFKSRTIIFSTITTLLLALLIFCFCISVYAADSKIVTYEMRDVKGVGENVIDTVINAFRNQTQHYNDEKYEGYLDYSSYYTINRREVAQGTYIVDLVIIYSGTVYEKAPPTTPPPVTTPPVTTPPVTTPPVTTPPVTTPPVTTPPVTTPPVTTPPVTTPPVTKPPVTTSSQPVYVPVVTPQVSQMPGFVPLSKDELIKIYKSILDSNRKKISKMINDANKDWKLSSIDDSSIELENGEVSVRVTFKIKSAWKSIRASGYMYFDTLTGSNYSKFGLRFKKAGKINESNPSNNVPDQLKALGEKLQTSLKDSIFWYNEKISEDHVLLNPDIIKKIVK